MKYVKNNRADEFGTFTQLGGIMKCSEAIATNTALKVAGDERYNGRIAARALYEQDEGEPLPFDRPANVDAETGEVYEVITDEARMVGDGE